MRRFDVSKVFQLFIIVFLFAFVGISILGSGQGFANGSSFNVPHVNDHFEKVQQGPAPTKEKLITTASSKNNKPSLWDRFTATCKDVWNWTKQTAVLAWQKTKEFCSKHEWLAGVLFWMTVITIAASFFKGEWDAVVDTIKGILDMLRHPILTLQNILYAFQHPVETGKAIWKVISESWERDVVHGNAKTRAHWLGYVVGQVVLSIVGTKGVDKVADIGKAAAISRIARLNEAAKVSKVGRAARIVNGINRVQERLRKLHIPQTISKVRGAVSLFRKTILQNKVAASILTVVGLTTGILAFDPEAIIQAFNKITVAAEKFEVKTAFKKAEKCFGYQTTPKYFASVNEPFFKCFYAADGQGGGSSSAKDVTAAEKDPNIVNGVKKPPVGLDYFNQVREHFNIPARTGDDDDWTVAVLRIDGREYWSKNGKWKQKAPGVEPNFKDREEYAQVRKLLGTNNESAGHAEGMAFYKALLDRQKEGITGGKAVLYVDKIPCGFCRRSGIKPLMKAVNLDELDLYYLENNKMHFVKFYRDPKNPTKILNTPYPTLNK